MNTSHLLILVTTSNIPGRSEGQERVEIPYTRKAYFNKLLNVLRDTIRSCQTWVLIWGVALPLPYSWLQNGTEKSRCKMHLIWSPSIPSQRTLLQVDCVLAQKPIKPQPQSTTGALQSDSNIYLKLSFSRWGQEIPRGRFVQNRN